MLTEFKMLDEIKTLNMSIKGASDSSDRNAKAMKYLTLALVFLGFVQVLVAGLSYWSGKSVIETKRDCFKSVLNTSDIDLNYKACLRNNGLSD